MAKARKVGLNKLGRIDLDLRENQLCLYMANRGLSAKCIGRSTGLSTGQIYYRLKRDECKLRDVRNGKTSFAKTVIAEFKVVDR